MDWKKEYLPENENPLDRLVNGYSNTAIFRTIGFVGDSMSSGEFESRNDKGEPGYHDMFEYSWGQFIARQNGLKAYNFSKGGMTAREYVESFADANRFWDPAKACQAYVIALGVNDVHRMEVPVGSIDDVDFEDWRNNKPTFTGYYATIVARLKAIQPRAKFFFVTVPGGNEDHNRLFQPVADFLHTLAERIDGAYVIDLMKYGPAHDDEMRDYFYLYGHMNPQGYLLIARLVDSYIDYIIRHNPKDFEMVPFIGTDLH